MSWWIYDHRSKGWIFQLGDFCGWQVTLCLAGMTEWVLIAENNTDSNGWVLSVLEGYWLLYCLFILLYFIYPPLHQASSHSVRICVTDGGDWKQHAAPWVWLEGSEYHPYKHIHKIQTSRFSTYVLQPRRKPRVTLISIRFCNQWPQGLQKTHYPKPRVTPKMYVLLWVNWLGNKI